MRRTSHRFQERRNSSGLDSPNRRDRANRANELRRLLRIASLCVAVALIVTGLVFAARFPDREEVLYAVWTSCGLAAFVIYVIAGRAPPRLVVPLTVGLTVLPAAALLISAAEPGALLPMMGGFSILAVAVPLFLPWTRTLRTGWVLWYTATCSGVTLLTGFGYLDAGQRIDVTTNIAIGAFIGWVGAELLERLRERNMAQENELLRLNRQLAVRATTDALTGLANRRQLDNDLQVLGTSRATERGSYAFIMLDLDQFKHLNDRFGHAVGDAALRLVSNELRRVVREGDSVYRYGGEEFLVIMPNANLEDARIAADRVRLSVAALQIETGPDAATNVTISGGVAFSTLAGEHWESVLAAADLALYEAKATGRNRICVASATVDPGATQASTPAEPTLRLPKPQPVAP